MTVLEGTQFNQKCQLSYGVLGEVDPRQVTHSTLFPVLTIAQSVCQLVTIYTALKSNRDFNADIGQQKGPSNSKAGDPGSTSTTLASLISGDLNTFPFDAGKAPPNASVFTFIRSQLKNNLTYVRNQLKRSKENHQAANPQQPCKDLLWEVSFSAFTWGWTLLHLNLEMSNAHSDKNDLDTISELLNHLSQDLLKDLDLQSSEKVEFLFSLPDAEAAIREGKVAEAQIKLKEVLRANGIDVDQVIGDLHGGDSPTGNKPNAAGDMTERLDQFQTLMKDVIPGLAGVEYFVDPRMYCNYHEYAEGVLPATNLFSTSTSLATLFHSIFCTQDSSSYFPSNMTSSRIATMVRMFTRECLPSDPFEKNRLGLRRFVFRYNGLSSSNGDSVVVEAFGQFAVGGSVVFCIPTLSLTICILTNVLTLERVLTDEVLQLLYEHYGLAPCGDY